MNLTIVFIALSLAMDAFSVSITHGLANKSLKLANALKIGIFFGSFQAVMPILGWLAGINIIDLISGFDHWIALGLLCFIGGRMIYESTKKGSEKLINSLSIGTLLILSIATSIDALAVGMSLSFLNVAIVTPAIIIGLVTFSLSFMGVYFGKHFGHFLSNKVEVLGGIILIAIGLKILLEHMLN